MGPILCWIMIFFRVIRTRTGSSQSSPLFGARFWVACVEGHDGKHYVLATRQRQKTVGMVGLMVQKSGDHHLGCEKPC